MRWHTAFATFLRDNKWEVKLSEDSSAWPMNMLEPTKRALPFLILYYLTVILGTESWADKTTMSSMPNQSWRYNCVSLAFLVS